jgi:hypothetical protein
MPPAAMPANMFGSMPGYGQQQFAPAPQSAPQQQQQNMPQQS